MKLHLRGICLLRGEGRAEAIYRNRSPPIRRRRCHSHLHRFPILLRPINKHSPLTCSDHRRQLMQMCQYASPIVYIHPVKVGKTHLEPFHLPITFLSTPCHLTHSSLDELPNPFLTHQPTFITRPHDFSS